MDVQALADAVLRCNITELSLAQNNISNDGAAAIAKVFKLLVHEALSY